MAERNVRTATTQDTEATGGRRSAPLVVPTLRVARVPLPRGLPSVHVPSVHVPGADRLTPHVDSRSVSGRALWIGGLGGLAIVGVLDWPVAAAIAAGTWVAERRARAYLADRAAEAAEPAAAATPARPRAKRAARGTRTRKTAASRTAAAKTAKASTAARGTPRATVPRQAAADTGDQAAPAASSTGEAG